MKLVLAVASHGVTGDHGRHSFPNRLHLDSSDPFLQVIVTTPQPSDCFLLTLVTNSADSLSRPALLSLPVRADCRRCADDQLRLHACDLNPQDLPLLLELVKVWTASCSHVWPDDEFPQALDTEKGIKENKVVSAIESKVSFFPSFSYLVLLPFKTVGSKS